MLRRKITDRLIAWKNAAHHLPLIIKGCRQCGKTASVLEFTRTEYAHTVYLNFFENPQLASIFAGSLEVDTLTMLMSAQLPGVRFVPGETAIILDEIQACPEARTALKFFALDGRYDIIATGSLLGVKGFGEPKSVPVGYEATITMVPMDFEEFLWAVGIGDDIITYLRHALDTESPVPLAMHEKMRELLLQYIIVGGMPAVVQHFVDTHNLAQVLAMQRDIIRSYEDDMVKYADNKDKIRIRKCFNSIPVQLAKENKKFQYSVIEKGGSLTKFAGSIEWIEEAGIVRRAYNLATPELPLNGNAIDNIFKLYMADTGLFVSMLEDGSQADIIRGNLRIYKGAIFENLIADIFGKMGRSLYYFHKPSGLEIDFFIRYRGCATPVEVKATNGNTKSLRTLLENPAKYHIASAIKLADTNIHRSGAILNLPLYMAAFLTDV